MLVKDRLDTPWSIAQAVDQNEIARFTALAEEWWKPDGKFRTVHDFNAARLGHILDQILRTFNRKEENFSGLSVLDVGCGAGLLCEPLAERGASVVGIDATARNVEIAQHHAAKGSLNIDYRHCLADQFLASGIQFDIVLNTEVVEHVTDPQRLMNMCSTLVRPGGALIIGTLNRTVRAYLIAILGAEFVLRWLPKGTHDWRKFVRPDEIEAMIAPHGLMVTDRTGVAFSPLNRRWHLSSDTGVNYLLTAKRVGR